MSHRRYEFELPYHVPAFMVSVAVSKLVQEHIWEHLPYELCIKITNASNGWSGFDITQADCDAIDDVTWVHIANELGLQWSPK